MLVPLALAMAACDGPDPSLEPSPAPDPAIHGGHRMADLDDPVDEPMGAAAWADDAGGGNMKYWIDMVDGGDAPWVPGCHYEHLEQTCNSWTNNRYGDDRWPGGIPIGMPPVWQELREWTNTECHPEQPFDEKHYNCDVICQDPTKTPDGIKHDHGCVGKVQAVCQPGVTVDSAKCMCWDNPNPPPAPCLAWPGGPGGGGGGGTETWIGSSGEPGGDTGVSGSTGNPGGDTGVSGSTGEPGGDTGVSGSSGEPGGDTGASTSGGDDGSTSSAMGDAALECVFQIPPPPDGEKFDTEKVNIDFEDGSKLRMRIPRVASAADCSSASHGWYYDDPNAPTMIILCPQTCAMIEASHDAKLEVVLGSTTEPAS